MTLKDSMNGPDWVIWIVFAIFLILTFVLLTGKGADLVAGYKCKKQRRTYKTNL